MPAAAKGTSKKSAEAFVRYAVEVLNYSTRELDSAPLRVIARSGCKACESVVAGIDEIADQRGSIEGGELTVVELGTVGREVDGQQLVQVVVDAASQKVERSRGVQAEVLKGGRVFYDFRLVQSGGVWLIGEIVPGDT